MVSRVRNVARNFHVGPNKTKENISENGYRRTKDKAFLVINGKHNTREEAKFRHSLDFEYYTSGFEFCISSLVYASYFNSELWFPLLQTNSIFYF